MPVTELGRGGLTRHKEPEKKILTQPEKKLSQLHTDLVSCRYRGAVLSMISCGSYGDPMSRLPDSAKRLALLDPWSLSLPGSVGPSSLGLKLFVF